MDYRLDSSNTTLAEILKEKGFTTGAAISAFVLDSRFGLNQGFDTYNDHFENERFAGTVSERTGDETTRIATQWLEQHKDEKFFYFLHYYDPHHPYEPPKKFKKQYPDNPYAAEIAFTDYCIGQVTDKLKELGLYDSTLIVIAGDHGEMLYEHNEKTHSYFIYQGAVKVPLIFKLPGTQKPKRIKKLAGLIDIVPTICSLLGIEKPENAKGVDLSKNFETETSDDKRYVFCESFYPTIYNANPLLGIVSDKFKYIQTTKPELYDLQNDPNETRNLVDKMKNQARIMQHELKQILKQQVRINNQSKLQLDQNARKRLESLGYVGGHAIKEDFTFDQTKDDAKDLLSFHNQNEKFSTLLAMKKYDLAKALCEKLIEIRPDFFLARSNLARVAMEQREFETAIAHLLKSLELRPDAFEAHQNLGIAYISLEKYQDAVEHLKKANQLRPENPDIISNLGIALSGTGKLQQASQYCSKAIELNPYHAANYTNLGTVQEKQKKINDAVSSYKKSLQLKPEQLFVLNRLSLLLYKQRKFDEAITYLNQSLQLNPKQPAIHKILGSALAFTGETDQAALHFNQAVKLTDVLATANGKFDNLIKISEKTIADNQQYSQIKIDYPFDNSIFPPEIVAPTFLWHDPQKSANAWLVKVTLSGNPKPIYAFTLGKQRQQIIDPEAVRPTNAHYKPSDYDITAKAWTPDKDTWKIIKQNSIEKNATVTFFGFNKNDTSKILSKASIRIATSKDPVGAPIFYRDVPLMPAVEKGTIKPIPDDALPIIAWRLRDIAKPSAPVVLKDMPTCANCHSFSSDGKTFGMDMDGPSGDKGAYGIDEVQKQMVITKDDIITWNSYDKTPEDHKNFGLFSKVSPDGKHVVSTLNEAVFVANYPEFKFLQSFFPTRGILVIYSIEEKTMKALPGADDTKYVQTNGTWSPDGKEIIFSRALAKDKYTSDERPTYSGDPKETQIQYDLYRIPFNDGKGGIAKPVEGASNNQMSNSFPKFSPDGKWIIYVQAKNGQLMRPDSKLHIIPAEGGTPRKMNCNLPLMNSWHSFSPNSKWLVFSSKGFTPFTQMFLTHIDENGNDSPAILIPNSTADNRAVNIPEFLNNSHDAIVSISAPTREAYRYLRNAQKLKMKGKFNEALGQLEKSIELNPYYAETHNLMGIMFFETQKIEKAIHHLKKATELDPDLYRAHNNLAHLLKQKGKNEQAVKHYIQAIKLDPKHKAINKNDNIIKGAAYSQVGNNAQAIKYWTIADRETDLPDTVLNELAWALVTIKDSKLRNPAQAVKHAIKACQLTNYKNPSYMDTLATAYAATRQFANAIKTAEKAVNLAQSSRNTALANDIRKRLQLYRAGKTYDPGY